MDIRSRSERTSSFNNSIETGLRILCILNESFPMSFDLQKLVYLDYITVHSGDIDNSISSLHPAVPYRNGEMLVRGSIIEKGLSLFVSRGLIEMIYDQTGIEYKASENSTPFLEFLEEDYLLELIERAKWVSLNFSSLTAVQLKEIIHIKTENLINEFNIEILQ